MFIRSASDKRRVVIVDYNHMAWSYAFGNATALSHTRKINGELVTVNTTIPAYTIKTINRWAKGGLNPIAICFDGEHSARCRKAYFAKQYGTDSTGKATGYKARREVHDPQFYNGIDLSFNLMSNGGISCYRAEGFEADDLIKACVDNAKVNYPDLPIDIITGDADLVPLVDEQVSVFLRDTKRTFALDKEIERLHYVQITPDNYQEYIEGRASYRNLTVPYNTILLTKLLRGDKSDEIPGKADWKPKMYNQLVEVLMDRGEDLENIFRYDSPTITYRYKGTTTEIPAEMVASTPKEQREVVIGDPPALTRICELIGSVCEPEDVEHVRRIYNGINLNGAFIDVPPEFRRYPARLSTPIKGYAAGHLQSELSKFGINIPT